MSIILNRKKRRNIKLSLLYKLKKFLPLSSEKKLKLYLDFAWIFSRFAHEESINLHINYTNNFLVNKIKNHNKVLDIGCGSGNVIRQILHKTNHIIGIDYDKSAVENLKKMYGNEIIADCIDVFDYLAENTEMFDVIILSHVIEHIEYREQLLNILSKKTKFLYVEVPDFESNYLNEFRRILGTDLIYSDADHVIEFDRDDLRSLLEENGFNVISGEFRGSVIKYWCESRF